MAKLDISKIAERLSQLNSGNKGGGSSLDFLSLKDGRNVLRILPPKDANDMFCEEVFVHYGVGKSEENKNGTTVVCPTTAGDNNACPICELVKELRNLSRKKEDTYDKQARALQRKKRVYFNAIDRAEDLASYKPVEGEEGKWTKDGEEASPVKVLGTGISIFKDILSIICDPEYGDITDAEEGLDLIITKTGTGFNTEYDVKTVRKESPVGLEGWESALNDLKVLTKFKTYDEISDILEGNVSSAKEVEEEAPKSDSTSSASPVEEDDLQQEIQRALQRRRQ